MRESSDGRDTVFPWGDASDALQGQPAYAVGCKVFGAVNKRAGTVTRVSDVVAPLVCIRWDGETDEVIYPMNAATLRRAWPWE
jgi:hypothetical protein